MRGPVNSRVLHTSTLLLPHGVWGEGQVRESRQLKSPPSPMPKGSEAKLLGYKELRGSWLPALEMPPG